MPHLRRQPARHLEQARKRLCELIEEGLNSGPGQALTPQRSAQLKKQVLGKMRRSVLSYVLRQRPT